MNLSGIIESLHDCPCGRPHTSIIKAVEIASGLLSKTADILNEYGFPKNILVVADNNTLRASDGILEVLNDGGFNYKMKMYNDLRVADSKDVDVLAELSQDVDGILSIGSGSLNDICRRAAFLTDKEFAIFATAPSMDGFASDTSPITTNNFKMTMPARQPSIIIADTKILANAPAELKSAGFGDVIAKFIALTDWRIATLVTGEYYCENVANLSRAAANRMLELADKVKLEDEDAARMIMESLVITGIAMKFADCVRPASGTEHTMSHYWEIKKLEKGLISDFHGKKVSVATLITARIYKQLVEYDTNPCDECIDWNHIYDVYGENFITEVKQMNNPTVTTKISPDIIRMNWEKIKCIVAEEVPDISLLYNKMKTAGSAITFEDISVEQSLGIESVIYHPFMRNRMTLMRMIPMLGLPVTIEELAEKATDFKSLESLN